ncbi:hypothetical protein [Nocardioides sp. B-3]|uniref:hypothetical protein n=1 Tax=Nocardioides sp. B-3 TaxID=2895565 RepID=UPI002152284C|nr:hypothetical protein [Nocardioides sp. B-3]UUZ61275.1 hypothetical protein LP418_12150 [Nocardioides sp. B-3]
MSDIHKLTGAYAVDAVDDIERAAFERHGRVRGLPRRARQPARDHRDAGRVGRGDAAALAARIGALRHLPGPPAAPGRHAVEACCVVSTSGRRRHCRRSRCCRFRLAAVGAVRQPLADRRRAGAPSTRCAVGQRRPR